MDSAAYIEHAVPLFVDFVQQNPRLSFVQDTAPCHSSRATRAAFEASGIEPIKWPSHSPDLNPISTYGPG